MRQNWLVLCGIVLFLTNCKVSKTGTTTDTKTDSVLIVTDTLRIPQKEYLITQKGDTLDSLHQEVDITIERLLPDTVTIMGVGDIMMGTKYPKPIYLPAGNGEYLWDEARALLKSADITFGNLEGTMLDGEGEPKNCSNPDACYLFKMPSRLSKNLKDAGFDLMSLANNHANDFGETGRKSTLSILDSLKIGAAGSIERPYTIEKIGHLKIGFVAFAPNKGTLTFYDLERAEKIVRKLDSLADMVLISIHGGAEGVKNVHVTRKTEFYYGEDRGNIYEFSHKMIDAGADIILGHGPHVARGIEVYNKRLIAYSLGNFLTYGRFNLRGAAGEAPLLKIKTGPDGEFYSGKIHPFIQSYENGPVKDPTNTVIRTMKKLSEEDFPENTIFIDDQGIISYIQN